jgi:hypothetical protein
VFHAHGYDKDSKVSRISQWRQVEKTTGHKPEGLQDEPVLKSELTYIWELYNEIKKGCEKIGYAELDCYQRVTGVYLTAWEASLMIDIDMIRVTSK